MSYYLATICYEIICGEGKHTPQFEEQVRLLDAGTREQAMQAAQEIGNQELLSWQYNQATKVEWKFLGIKELSCLPDLFHGAELYQQHHEIEHADGYRNYIKDKTIQLQRKPDYAIHSI
ncbi:DUF4288 domain-containing protein [Flavihumibacter sp. CACIAM 22H1]|uniref:DUF4288 domain-containing protein n=1 Tax=Flavihumibacter sp. CACIAM 22H1 TaxID=1812911 RepID=UPI0007A7D2DC|nr:DUF4288 domain-containing protein [Flavihumibacter sp. CACIAM 22H1]KYP16557.1 MAG: hypothetical protein A1D16_09015 [Flavihumibacter sp. CACIAM 22H1]